MSNAEQSKTTTSSTSPSPRVITIVSTRGEKNKIPFEGTNWEDLKSLLEKGGKCLDDDGNLTKTFSSYDLSNMKCVESFTRGTLEHPKAVVPAQDFNLFLMPIKSKSGGEMSRSEANAEIKAHIEKDGDTARNHFNAEKNYTNKPTATLIDLLESYKPGTKKRVSSDKAEAIGQVVDSVKKAKKVGNKEEILAQLSGLSTDEKLDLVIQLLLEVKSDGSSSDAVAEAIVVAAPVKSQAELDKEKADKEEADRKEAEEKEKKRKKKEEDDKLEAEMREMAGGFGDVRL